MVRAHVKQSPSEEKKELPKKKAPVKKKAVVTGVWPCKINGCNKQFAREADLKRHQRTTKLHSMPGFACPQCDATFTRTDALRRHQKSRHNGVIIEPTEAEKKDGADDGVPSNGSKSRSRSASLSSKGKEKSSVTNATPPTALAQPGTAGPASGPSSYYRQHTVTNSVFVTPRPPGVMEAQYQQGIGLPTSATRLHQANWPPPPPPPWGTDGPPPQMGPISYHQVPNSHTLYFQPSPYYRPNGAMLHPHPQPPHQPQINPELVAHSQGMQNGVSTNGHSPQQDNNTSGTNTPLHNNAVDPRLSHPDPNPNQQLMDVETSTSTSHTPDAQKSSFPSAPVIDPALDVSSNVSGSASGQQGNHGPNSGLATLNEEEMKAISLQITQAAMEAVLESAKRESNLADVTSKASGTPNSDEPEMQDTINGIYPDGSGSRESDDGDADADGEADADEEDERLIAGELSSNDKIDGSHGYGASLGRPEPMEHMLTEDGEPMLNPAELLTQESLASPPPS